MPRKFGQVSFETAEPDKTKVASLVPKEKKKKVLDDRKKILTKGLTKSPSMLKYIDCSLIEDKKVKAKCLELKKNPNPKLKKDNGKINK